MSAADTIAVRDATGAAPPATGTAALPLVSVIVLNFNGEHLIRPCLDHLLAQTYPHRELIVVDNNSTDGSRAILDEYEGRGEITVVRSPSNRGCPGGRNLGIAAAHGDIIAFMDNDGFASPEWLAEAVRDLTADANVGAVASLVFFNRHKLILNGAGGTLNLRGYGGDFCFKEPFEFARLPRHVLYPMGCGMVMRRAVLDAMQGFDELLFNYYDDAEVGFWAWRQGLQVVNAPHAWVDHEFGASDEINRNKLLLCERNRIRTVIKYFPRAVLPGWLLRELLSFAHVRPLWLWSIPFRAWAWNLRHLGSALRRRRAYGRTPAAIRTLLVKHWGTFPPPRPNNHLHRPDPDRATARVECDGSSDGPQLNFGWYQPERHGEVPMRWTTGTASLLLRVPEGARAAELTLLASQRGQCTTMRLRRFGELTPAWEASAGLSTRWETYSYECVVPPGLYELLLDTHSVHLDAGGRELGAGVAWVAVT